MDEMKLKLTTRFMRGIVAKMISRFLYKKLGYHVDIRLNDLDVEIINGETRILANLEANVNSKEFMKIIKNINLED